MVFIWWGREYRLRCWLEIRHCPGQNCGIIPLIRSNSMIRQWSRNTGIWRNTGTIICIPCVVFLREMTICYRTYCMRCVISPPIWEESIICPIITALRWWIWCPMITSIMKPTEKVTGMAMTITAAGTVGRKDRPDGKKCRHFGKNSYRMHVVCCCWHSPPRWFSWGMSLAIPSRATIIPIARTIKSHGWTGRTGRKMRNYWISGNRWSLSGKLTRSCTLSKNCESWTACPVVIRICPITDRMPGGPRQRAITGM